MIRCFYFSILLTCGYSFNVDIDNTVNIRGDEGTMFGYSTVMLNNVEGSWVLVGAPHSLFKDRPDIETPGNVYKCRVNFTLVHQDSCIPLKLRTPEDTRWPGTTGFEEDNQLLGASIANFNDTVVVCAPLWQNMVPVKNNKITYPVGRCHNIDKTLNTSNTRIFKRNGFYIVKGEDSYQNAEAGFSISGKQLENDHDLTTLLGAPGLYNAKGGFLRYSSGNGDGNRKEFFNSFSHHNISSDIKDSVASGTLMGYSITTGKLAAGHNCRTVVVLGAPHFKTAEGKTGAVLVACLESGTKMTIKKQLFGRKHGSGYGTAVVFDDINGDGLDDLIVGAPYQYDRVIDTGAVYIYHGVSGEDVLIQRQIIKGPQVESARFGITIQCMEDLNNDRFKDIVVGAPYQDDLRGAIYIYHGGPTELTLVQEIHALDIDEELHSFGWYLSTPYDIDNNNYPDFVVGSYMSDMISIFRTRPIIDLKCSVNLTPTMIPLNSSGLECQDQEYRPCLGVEICFSYTGYGIPNQILVSFEIMTDTLRTGQIPQKSSRVNFNVTNYPSTFKEENKEIKKGKRWCRKVHVFVPTVTRQFYSALKEELRFEVSFGLGEKRFPGQLKPILNNKPKIQKASAWFDTGCNVTCSPDLKLEVTTDLEDIVFGETTELVIQIKVITTNDPSHGTRVTIYTSTNTNYLGFNQPQGQNTELGECMDELDQNNKSVIYCDVKTSMYQQQQALFNVLFNVSREVLTIEYPDVYAIKRSVEFDIETRSTSIDRDMSDNRYKLEVPVRFHSQLELSGISTPEQNRLSDIPYLEMVHTFDVYNTGPSPADECAVRICQPNFGLHETNRFQVWGTDDLIKANVSGAITAIDSSVTSTYTLGTTIKTSAQSQSATSRTRTKPVFKYISCETVDQNSHVIYDINIQKLDVGQRKTFEIPVVLSKNGLSFEKISAIMYTLTGEIKTIHNDKVSVTAANLTSEVTTEIFPEVIIVGAEEVDIWIIVGGCVAGIVFLVILVVLLWKCGFFKRKKKDDIIKWKRQTGYYASRQSQMRDHTPRQSHIVTNSVNW